MALHHPIYALQDQAASILTTLPSLAGGKLCGGTALARCYLHHRVSFDLDFFLPTPFDPVAFGQQLKQAGFKAKALDVVQDAQRANQWHGFLVFGQDRLKLSAVEDAYFDVYPAIAGTMGSTSIRTEAIEGLYHRKLLTITHTGGDGMTATGGRQTARDLFDLWVLSQAVAPLTEFMATLPYDYPLPAFEDGLDCMPWFDLIPELKEIQTAPEWQHGKDMEVVRKRLFLDLGIDIDAELEAAAIQVASKRPRP